MEAIRTELKPGVFLTCLQTDKFKTACLSLNLLTQLNRDTASLGALLPRVLRRGCRQYPDMEALSRELDRLYGTRLDSVVRKRGEVQCLGFYADFVDDAWLPEEERLLEQITGLMGQLLLQPFTRGGLLLQSYVENERGKLLDDIRSLINDKQAYANRRLTEQMCFGEDYAVAVLGSEETVGSIGYQKLTRYYRELLQTAPVELFYCGSAAPERVAAALSDALATLPRGEVNFDIGTDIRMNTVEETTRYFTESLDVTQGKLSMGFRLGDAMEDPDFPALRVFNAAFGGAVTSKLFENVREKLSLCYYASSALDLHKGVLLVASGIEFDKYDAALSEIFAQLRALQDGQLTDAELTAARKAVATDHRAIADSPAALESFTLSQNLLGLDYGPEEFAALAEMVTKEQVVRIAGQVTCDAVYFLKGKEDEADDGQ